MRRREFLSVVGGVAAGWPLVAHAQQAGTIRRLGVLMNSNAANAIQRSYWEAFVAAIKDTGWINEQNIRIETRWSDGDAKLMSSQAQELVGFKPDVLVSVGSGNVHALRRVNRTIPTVFLQVSDPVSQGIVKNLARPGENTTGFSAFEFETGGKWLGQLKQVAPLVSHAVVVFNPSTSPQGNLFVRSIEAAARSLGMDAVVAHVPNDAELETAIAKAASQVNTGLVFPPDSFLEARAVKVVELANRHRLPAIYPVLLYARAGGLICYTVDYVAQFRDAASYVDRILKGANPGDLPVQLPTRFSLVINRRTAKVLGLEVPERLLFTADEVIE